MKTERTIPSPEPLAFSRAPDPDARRSPPKARGAARPRVLLVATVFKLPYRVLRCAAEAGACVFVLGSGGAKGLRYSKYCQAFIDFEGPIDGRRDPVLALEINRLVRALSIELVAPADAASTRSLLELSPLIDAPCFPMPDLAAFDLLNDKWRFTQLCGELNILCPDSWLFDDVEQLRAQARGGDLPFPLIAKPLSQDGGAGCVEIADKSRLGKLSKVSYRPIIVQSYIPGADIGSSMFCRDGEIEAFLTHSYIGGVYKAHSEPRIYDEMSKIARRLRLTGIFNFDMRLTDAGEVFFLECNPRVYYKMAMSMLAGVNFLAFGCPWRRGLEAATVPSPVALPFPKAMLRSLLAPWELDAAAWRVLGFLFADPVPFLRESLRIQRGR